MVAVSYHHTVNVLQDVATDPAGPFDRPEWFALLAGEAKPCVVLAADGGQAMALPLANANGRLEALRNWYAFTWRPLGQSSPAFLRAAARDLRRRTHRVTVWPIPDEDGSAGELAAAFRTAGWSVLCEPCDHNHVLPVAGRSFAEYWAGRPGAMRTTFKRKAKKVVVELFDRFHPAASLTPEQISILWQRGADTPAPTPRQFDRDLDDGSGHPPITNKI